MPDVHKYDLEDRTLLFARMVRDYVAGINKTPSLFSDLDQLLRSSGSVGANYIEANEALSKKDFVVRVKICRKEAKESIYWLRLLDSNGDQNKNKVLQDEASQLMRIFGSILEKTVI